MYISIPFVNLKPLNFYPFYCKYVFFTDNVNLVFSHLHPPTRTVALIRHRVYLYCPFHLSFSSLVFCSDVNHWWICPELYCIFFIFFVAWYVTIRLENWIYILTFYISEHYYLMWFLYLCFIFCTWLLCKLCTWINKVYHYHYHYHYHYIIQMKQ